MTRDDAGFTIVEVLVAVMVLGVGIIAMAGSSGLITRMVGRGQMATTAAQVASQRLEQLRNAAASTDPRCTSVAFTSSAAAVVSQGVTLSWQVTPLTGSPRTVRAIVRYPISGGTHTDTISTLIWC